MNSNDKQKSVSTNLVDSDVVDNDEGGDNYECASETVMDDDNTIVSDNDHEEAARREESFQSLSKDGDNYNDEENDDNHNHDDRNDYERYEEEEAFFQQQQQQYHNHYNYHDNNYGPPPPHFLPSAAAVPPPMTMMMPMLPPNNNNNNNNPNSHLVAMQYYEARMRDHAAAYASAAASAAWVAAQIASSYNQYSPLPPQLPNPIMTSPSSSTKRTRIMEEQYYHDFQNQHQAPHNINTPATPWNHTNDSGNTNDNSSSQVPLYNHYTTSSHIKPTTNTTKRNTKNGSNRTNCNNGNISSNRKCSSNNNNSNKIYNVKRQNSNNKIMSYQDSKKKIMNNDIQVSRRKNISYEEQRNQQQQQQSRQQNLSSSKDFKTPKNVAYKSHDNNDYNTNNPPHYHNTSNLNKHGNNENTSPDTNNIIINKNNNKIGNNASSSKKQKRSSHEPTIVDNNNIIPHNPSLSTSAASPSSKSPSSTPWYLPENHDYPSLHQHQQQQQHDLTPQHHLQQVNNKMSSSCHRRRRERRDISKSTNNQRSRANNNISSSICGGGGDSSSWNSNSSSSSWNYNNYNSKKKKKKNRSSYHGNAQPSSPSIAATTLIESFPPPFNPIGKTGVSALYELCDYRHWDAPDFVYETKDDYFVMIVRIHNEELGRGRGGTKVSAKQDAARRALVKLCPGIIFDVNGIVLNNKQNNDPYNMDHTVVKGLPQQPDSTSASNQALDQLAPNLAMRLAIRNPDVDTVTATEHSQQHQQMNLPYHSRCTSPDSSISTSVSMTASISKNNPQYNNNSNNSTTNNIATAATVPLSILNDNRHCHKTITMNNNEVNQCKSTSGNDNTNHNHISQDSYNEEQHHKNRGNFFKDDYCKSSVTTSCLVGSSLASSEENQKKTVTKNNCPPSSIKYNSKVDACSNGSPNDTDDDAYYAKQGASVCSALLHAMAQIDDRIKEPPTYKFEACANPATLRQQHQQNVLLGNDIKKKKKNKRKDVEGMMIHTKNNIDFTSMQIVAKHRSSFKCDAKLILHFDDSLRNKKSETSAQNDNNSQEVFDQNPISTTTITKDEEKDSSKLCPELVRKYDTKANTTISSLLQTDSIRNENVDIPGKNEKESTRSDLGGIKPENKTSKQLSSLLNENDPYICNNDTYLNGKLQLNAVGTGATKREARHVASAKLLALLFPKCKGMTEVKLAAELAREKYAATKAHHNKQQQQQRQQHQQRSKHNRCDQTLSQLSPLLSPSSTMISDDKDDCAYVTSENDNVHGNGVASANCTKQQQKLRSLNDSERISENVNNDCNLKSLITVPSLDDRQNKAYESFQLPTSIETEHSYDNESEPTELEKISRNNINNESTKSKRSKRNDSTNSITSTNVAVDGMVSVASLSLSDSHVAIPSTQSDSRNKAIIEGKSNRKTLRESQASCLLEQQNNVPSQIEDYKLEVDAALKSLYEECKDELSFLVDGHTVIFQRARADDIDQNAVCKLLSLNKSSEAEVEKNYHHIFRQNNQGNSNEVSNEGGDSLQKYNENSSSAHEEDSLIGDSQQSDQRKQGEEEEESSYSRKTTITADEQSGQNSTLNCSQTNTSSTKKSHCLWSGNSFILLLFKTTENIGCPRNLNCESNNEERISCQLLGCAIITITFSTHTGPLFRASNLLHDEELLSREQFFESLQFFSKKLKYPIEITNLNPTTNLFPENASDNKKNRKKSLYLLQSVKEEEFEEDEDSDDTNNETVQKNIENSDLILDIGKRSTSPNPSKRTRVN